MALFIDTYSHHIKKNAEELKETGNALYKQGNFTDAIKAYSKAIELKPTAVYYSNRSSANLKLGRLDCAMDDATQAIIIDKTYLKGYARKADAHMALKQYAVAIVDYERAKNIEENNTWLISQIAKCNELRQKEGNMD